MAELKVKLNELNESLSECIRQKNFERATTLQEEFNRLDSERSLLMSELKGINVQATSTVATTEGGGVAGSISFKREPPGADVAAGESEIPVITIDSDSEKEDGEEDEDELGENGERSNMEMTIIRRQLKYLSRLSADVVLKTNRMVVVTIQKSPTLWTLPPSLRSLLSSLVREIY